MTPYLILRWLELEISFNWCIIIRSALNVLKNIPHPTIKFGNNGPDITIQNNHVHLGLNFQSDANWKLHIQGIYEKACSRLKHVAYAQTHTLSRCINKNISVLYPTCFRIWRCYLGQLQ